MCQQMCSDISHTVTRQVLLNLEGAVIASVPGGPLGGTPVRAASASSGSSTRKLSFDFSLLLLADTANYYMLVVTDDFKISRYDAT